MFHHRSGNQSFCPVNDLGSQSIYIIRYPTCGGTFRIPGVTNPVESTLGLTELLTVTGTVTPGREQMDGF
jgi:hypothetical protein